MKKVKITKKPWGQEQLIALCDSYAGKIITVRKGHRLSLQYHQKKEETFFVYQGKVRITFGMKKTMLKRRVLTAGGVIHIPPGMIHRMEALTNCRIIEVSTPELTDIVRIEDDYNRIRE